MLGDYFIILFLQATVALTEADPAQTASDPGKYIVLFYSTSCHHLIVIMGFCKGLQSCSRDLTVR